MLKKNLLSLTHPQLAKEWHLTKNGELTPSDVTYGSSKKVWWKCPKGKDHEYEATITARTSGSKCTVCRGFKVVKSNCLATKYPKVAKEWHPTKNGKLTPFDVISGSDKKVWWRCSVSDDHVYLARIRNKKDGNKCPICRGLIAIESNCLASTHPMIAKEWHPTKNGNLTPYDVTHGSGKRIWWKCLKDNDHDVYSASVAERVRANSCKVCLNRKVVRSNCLATTHPEISKEWHSTKNGSLTPYDIRYTSIRDVWWKCPKGNDHIYKARIRNRSRGSKCLVCEGLVVVNSNCLATTHPEIVKEWHPTKNGSLTPYDVIAGSQQKVWWKCPKGSDHEYLACISNKIRSEKCSVCAGRTVVLSNCLATVYPEISKEWHPTKNESLTPYDVTSGSDMNIWWLCQNNKKHIWKTKVALRKRGRKCPFCSIPNQSKEELRIIFELKTIFPNINPKGERFKVNDENISVDLYIKDLKLIIEYDGSWWHKDRFIRDQQKTQTLLEAGFNVLRIREKPLEIITSNDILTEQPFKGKLLVDAVLKQIIELFEIQIPILEKIESYVRSKKFQNETSFENYLSIELSKPKKRG